MSNETRTVSATGGEKGVKPERYDLIPREAMDTLARVYAFGATKYGRHVIGGLAQLVDLCSCERQTATRIALTKLEDSASRAMIAIFASATRGTPNASDSMRVSGIRSTESANVPTISTIASRLEAAGHYRPSTGGGLSEVSLQRMASAYLLNRVESVLSAEASSELGVQTSITITLTDLLEGFYVHAAIRAWASSATRRTVFGEHSSTCGIHQATISSDGTVWNENRANWRRGYEWSKSYAAAMRHLTAFWSGETYDSESGLPHIGHAMFHLAALSTWLEQGGEGGQFDDRYRPAVLQDDVNKIPDPEPDFDGVANEILGQRPFRQGARQIGPEIDRGGQEELTLTAKGWEERLGVKLGHEMLLTRLMTQDEFWVLARDTGADHTARLTASYDASQVGPDLLPKRAAPERTIIINYQPTFETTRGLHPRAVANAIDRYRQGRKSGA